MSNGNITRQNANGYEASEPMDCEPLAEYLWQNKDGTANVNVAIQDIKPVQSTSNLRAFVAIKYGDVTIKELKLVQGKQGIFLAYPSKAYLAAGGVQKFQDFIYMDNDFKNFLAGKVLQEYEQIMARAAT